MKHWLLAILPDTVRTWLLRRKYITYNRTVHMRNISERRVIRIVCGNDEKRMFLKSLLYKTFGGDIEISGQRFYFHPVAVIEKPESTESYRKLIGAKSRNMLKKAYKNGVVCQCFDWNEKRDEIFDIHRSSMKRQGKRMSDAYLRYPEEIKIVSEKDFRIVHIGAFIENRLVGYIELYIYGNFAMTNRILGHKAYLKYAIMNALIEKSVAYMIEQDIAYLNYLTMQNRKQNSLSSFKYRVGFREYSLAVLQ
jgi:hypothetical protein